MSGGQDNVVRLWDAASGALLNTLSGHGQWVHTVAFAPDGKQIASGGLDGAILVWDVPTP